MFRIVFLLLNSKFYKEALMKNKLLCTTMLALTLWFVNAAFADLICAKVVVKKNKPELSIATSTKSKCPKGSKLVINTSQFLTNIQGLSAGGALTGTYPNPILANGSVGMNNFTEMPGAKISHTSLMTLASNFSTSVTFDTEEYDNLAFFPGSGSTLTIPVSGLYFIKGDVNYVLNATGTRAVFIDKNNSLFINGIAPGSASNFTPVNVIAVERLAQGDTLTMRTVQSSGGNLSTLSSDGSHAYLQVQWLAP